MITLDVASTDRHFEQILDLQRRNHVQSLPPEIQDREGFVFAQHSVPLLRRMAAEIPQAIALNDDIVVGYCLAMPVLLRDEVPVLTPMFDHFSGCDFRGRPLSEIRFFVGGQVCVDRDYRGQGLLARLYEHVRVSAPTGYELRVTEISVRNQVSVRAHARMGFETISSYSDDREDWVVVAWPLNERR